MRSIVIIGGGSIGKRHLRNLLALGERDITAVEVNEARREELVREFNVHCEATLDSAYEKKHFQIAFICSPSRFHIEQALVCAKKGSDLFIEKPLSHTLAQAPELLSIAEEKKLITMVGSNWKFYPLFQEMKELISVGAIGRLLSARCQFGQYLPDWHPWEDHRKGYSANASLGGGVLLDSHEFDYLTWFVEQKVNKVACFAGRVSDVTVDTEDVAEVILQFESGAVGEIHADYLQRVYQRDFEFIGEQGTISWKADDKRVILRVKGEDEKMFPLAENYDMNDMYKQEVKHFLDCVNTRTQTITPVEKGAEVLRLICAAKESTEKDKIVFL